VRSTRPLVEAFRRVVARDAAAPLIVSPTRSCSAGEISDLARAVEGRLFEKAIEPEHVVALMAPNGAGFVAGLLGLRRRGVAALLIDHRTPPREVTRIVDRLGCGGVLRCPTAWPEGVDAFELETTATGEPRRSEAAVIKLSSGSTGMPRGIATGAEALIADDAQLSRSMDIDDTDRLLATVPFSHSYGLSSLVLPLVARGTVLVLPDSATPFDPLLAAIDCAATIFPTVPAYVAGLLRIGDPPPIPKSLRRIITAGAPLAAETAARFRERFDRSVHVFYGASECGGICYDREGGGAERGTVGEPVEGVTVRIEELDPDSPGEGGRVVVASPSVASGYFPESDDKLSGGRYRTDDLAVWHDGSLALVGRINDIINVKGRKVNPREVEKILAELPTVEEVRVLGIAGPRSDGQRVRAVIACRPGSLAADEVLGWCRGRLSDYKIPRSVVLVERIPRTDRGKVDVAALAQLRS